MSIVLDSVLFVGVVQIIRITVDTDEAASFFLTTVGNPSNLSVLGARLLISMKEAGIKSLNQGTTHEESDSMTISVIEFANLSQNSLGVVPENDVTPAQAASRVDV